MRIPFSTTLIALAASAALFGPAQAASVDVHFIDPEQFTDADIHAVPATHALDALQRYLVRLGARLPANQTLDIAITDIDLAGDRRPVAGRGNDLRLLKGLGDAPRISLRYRLLQQDRVVKEGTADLIDLAYLDRPLRNQRLEPFPYEKRLLAEWFDRTFTGASADRGRR